MGRDAVYKFVEEKFNAHLEKSNTMQEAFEKAQAEMGYDAYSGFHSFNRVRKRKKASKK